MTNFQRPRISESKAFRSSTLFFIRSEDSLYQILSLLCEGECGVRETVGGNCVRAREWEGVGGCRVRETQSGDGGEVATQVTSLKRESTNFHSK